MARRAFFSFHYGNDVSRANVVRNSWVTQGREAAGFIDAAEFEKILKQSDKAIKKWIDEQLKGTTVTVVLIGTNTLEREYVQYEICQSLQRGNAVIGVHISGIKDLRSMTSTQGNVKTKIGQYDDGSPAYFSSVAHSIHNYVTENGYQNLGTWIENAAKASGK